jgi:hypothetical protein
VLGLETYSELLDALDLCCKSDAEAAAIQARLARARPQVHVCAGVPALVVDNVDGLVELLRRRATERSVALKVNPEDCIGA